MISASAILMAVIYLIVAGLIFWLLHWLIGYVGVPEPFNKIARVVLAVAAVLICVAVLLGMIGHPIIRFP